MILEWVFEMNVKACFVLSSGQTSNVNLSQPFKTLEISGCILVAVNYMTMHSHLKRSISVISSVAYLLF